MKIFGICGKKQVGKDTFANYVPTLLPNQPCQKLALAKALKDLATDGFQIPSKNVWGSDADKNYPIATWGRFFEDAIRDRYHKKADDLLSGREFLQVLGTDIIRMGNLMGVTSVHFITITNWLTAKLGEKWKQEGFKFADIWVEIISADIEKFRQAGINVVCVPDVRFFNELQGLGNIGATLIRIYRDTGHKDSIAHPSELEMDRMSDDLFDYVLYEEQNHSLKDLRRFVTHTLIQEGLVNCGGMAI